MQVYIGRQFSYILQYATNIMYISNCPEGPIQSEHSNRDGDLRLISKKLHNYPSFRVIYQFLRCRIGCILRHPIWQ